jgi:hypothetical protein
MQFPQWWKVSDYLKVRSGADAQDATKVPYVWAVGKEGMTFYDALESDTVVAEAWHKGMTQCASGNHGRMRWELWGEDGVAGLRTSARRQ